MAGEFKPGDRVRNVKRGKFYEIVGSAQVQAPEDAPLTDYEVVTVYRAEHDGELWVRRAPEFRDGRFEPAPTSSPDTPEAGAAGERDALREEGVGLIDPLREEIARALCRHQIGQNLRWEKQPREEAWLQGAEDAGWAGFVGQADACLPIIDRHTAKAINNAVMAQDTALETALRERDEARSETERLKGELFERERLVLYWQRDSQNHRDKWIETGNILLAAESALSSEQSAHAETRKALEEVEDALEHLRSIAHHI